MKNTKKIDRKVKSIQLLTPRTFGCRIVLTSKTGNKKRELAEKWVLNPRARLPIAWTASTATAIFTSVISCKQKRPVKLLAPKNTSVTKKIH